MFRKITTVLLFILVLSSIAHAEQSTLITDTVEDFSIRNDIRFLMTMDEVKANETLEPAEGLYSSHEHSIKIKGSMAGFDNVSGEYIFDKNIRLESFVYYLNGSLMEPKSLEQTQKDYEYVETALRDKYGESLENYSGYYSSYLIDYANQLEKSKDAGIIKLSERFIQIKSGGYAKIEHWIGYYNLTTIIFVEHYVQYTYYSDDMMNSILADYEKKQDQKNTDY